MFVYRYSRRLSEDGGRLPLVALYTCAVTYVLGALYPANESFSALAASIELLSFVMMFPLLFINTKRFTNLSLPQWRSVRAFSLGAPLLIGIDGAVSELGGQGSSGTLPSYQWVPYCYGAFSVLIAGWRFISTPRQRMPIVLLMLVPVVIIAADLSYRLGGWLLWNLNPAVGATLGCMGALSMLVVFRQQFAVRPVPRSSLIDQVQDALLVLDPNQRIADCNHAAASWLGESEKTLIGSEARHWLPAELHSALSAEVPQHLVVPWTKQEAEHWFEVHSAPLIVDKMPNGSLVTLRDVTDRRRVEIALTRSREQLELANARLELLANTDHLTGLHNRRHFMGRLRSEIERHGRSGLTLGLLMLDLDHFKRVNDQFGHPIGDLVLKRAADCMRETLRESDVVGRIGGEEFAVIVVDAKTVGPTAIAERLRHKLGALVVNTDDDRPVRITASIGCVQIEGEVTDVDTLVKFADEALYQSKRGGRDRVTTRMYSSMRYSMAAS
jgi:diguanylate cyclase (GGDEF)-like protein/PAS domain S-box-containing protein